MSPTSTPDYILYTQHGWADNNKQISQLGQSLASPKAEVVAPNLGYLKTWWRIAALVDQVDQIAMDYSHRYPEAPWRIVGHSMGGLIWLEVLNRHPDWWPRVEKLALVGSPVGGSDLGRIFDPFQWGLGIARDLGVNRRPLAEKLAQQIPTLIIAGNVDGGSDGTVTLQCTQFRHAQYIELAGIKHAELKNHVEVAQTVRQFWEDAALPVAPTEISPLAKSVIVQLQAISGMTDAHYRDFPRAPVWATLSDGITLRTWKNAMGVEHIFVADADEICCFAGFVGWAHTSTLYQTLDAIRTQYGAP